MKLSSLQVENVGVFADSTFEFSQFNVVRGLNGSGKTTLGRAIAWLLLGRFDLTDEAGRNSDLIMTPGANEMRVSADIQIAGKDAGHVSRIRNRMGGSTAIVEPLAGSELINEDARRWLDLQVAPVDILHAVLSSKRFVKLNEKEQKSLLAEALSVGKQVDLGQPLIDAMLASKAGSDLLIVVDSLEKAIRVYDGFYKHRTEIGRKIKALGELSSPVPSKELLLLAGANDASELPEVSDVREAIAAVRSSFEQVIAERSRIVEAFRQTQEAEKNKGRKELELEKSLRESHWKAKTTAKAALQKLQAFILSDEDLEKYREAVNKATTYESLKSQISVCESDITRLRKQIEGLRDSSKPRTCPTCNRPLEVKDVSASIKELTEQTTASETKLAGLKQRKEAMLDPATAKDKCEAHKRAMLDRKKHDDELRSLADVPDTLDVSDIEAKLAKLPGAGSTLFDQAPAPDTSELDRREAELKAKISRGDKLLSELSGFNGQLENFAATSKKKQEWTAQREAAQKVVEAFDEGGPVRASLVGKFEQFKEKLLTNLKYFGFDCELKLEPYTFTVRTGAKHSKQIKQLSESEQLRFSIAFQCSLAQSTGVNFVIIDEADRLLQELRDQLAAAMYEIGLDQVIILMAAKPQEMDESDIPEGISYFDISNVEEQSSISAVYRGA